MRSLRICARPRRFFGSMPPDREAHHALGVAAQHVLERLGGETARVARVPVVLLVGELAGADVELGRVDHDDVVAGVDVGRPDRLVLPAEQVGRLGGDLAQHLALGVDHVPGAVDVSGFRGERAQRILTKNCGGVATWS